MPHSSILQVSNLDAPAIQGPLTFFHFFSLEVLGPPSPLLKPLLGKVISFSLQRSAAEIHSWRGDLIALKLKQSDIIVRLNSFYGRWPL